MADKRKPGYVDWAVVGPRVAEDLRKCEEKFDTLSPRDQAEYLRFKKLVDDGQQLNFRNVVSLRRIVNGLGAL